MTIKERRNQVYDELNKAWKKARYGCLSRGEIEAIRNAITVMEIYMSMEEEFEALINAKYGKENADDDHKRI